MTPRRRRPAWCDRILYLDSSAAAVEQYWYSGVPGITFSDHRAETRMIPERSKPELGDLCRRELAACSGQRRIVLVILLTLLFTRSNFLGRWGSLAEDNRASALPPWLLKVRILIVRQNTISFFWLA